MKRREFMTGMVVGAAASALPMQAVATPDVSSSGNFREEQGAYVERFAQDARVRSGMALGGIGAGFVELRKDGRFYNWSIFNNFPKETGPEFTLPAGEFEDPMASNLFFKVRYQVEGEEPRIKLLQLAEGMNEGGALGIAYTFPWMQAVDQIDYSARFPFARLRFSDAEMPFEIVMDAWSPLIPHDVKNSALPVAFFDFTLITKTDNKVDVMLLMVARNTVGYETSDRYYTAEIHEAAGHKTVQMSCGGMDKTFSTWGQIAMASLSGDSTHYCGWEHRHPYYEFLLRHNRLPNLDDTDGTASLGASLPSWMPPTNGRNFVDPKTGKKRVHSSESDPDSRLFCTLGRSWVVQGKGSREKHSFVYAWNFPNLYAESEFRRRTNVIEGHYYSNFFNTALEVAAYAVSQRAELQRRSRQFLDDFFASSADVVVLEQVNSHLNTFVTSGRLVKSGDFGVLEGLASTWSWGPIATMDVMLYGTAPVIALFPELQKATMRCHRRVQTSIGQVAHGLQKNFRTGEDGTAGVSNRLDLPGQFVILALRDYFWTNDKEYLKELYPAIQRAIDYITEHRAFAGDQIPIMRGIECSYDNFPMYGYSAYLVSQWLCAIASAVRAAEAMGDSRSQSKYEAILQRAKQQMENKLWNGTYYRLYNDADKSGGRGDISEGCLTDQLVGQWAAHQSALGHLLDKEKINAALSAILQASYKPGLGLRNCSWPGTGYWSDVDVNIWMDQGNTCWSGVELAFASFLLYEGHSKAAFDLIRTVDRRYRKNGLYWDHQEFGGHYFRAMSGWAILNGMLGLGVNQGLLRFDPQLGEKTFRLFFAVPSATAHFVRSPEGVALRCLTGTLSFDRIEIRGGFSGQARIGNRALALAQPAVRTKEGFTQWSFASPCSLRSTEEIVLW
jgi:non-lysosomal glucosylceramidase